MVIHIDTVVAIDGGPVVEKGSPGELVRRAGSRFEQLWVASVGEREGKIIYIYG